MLRLQTQLGLIGLVFLISCGEHLPSADHKNKAVFRYNEAAGVSNLDPAMTTRFEDVLALNHLYEGLVELDAEMHIVPAIAKDWEIDSTRKVYTFHLRDDVFFHDNECFTDGVGRKVTAFDFVYSFFRITDPSFPSPGKYIFSNLKKEQESDFLGFKAIDEQTLIIYLKQPQPSFLHQLTLTSCSVVPEEAVDFYGIDFRGHPVGTGPFVFRHWREGTKLVLVKNERYHVKDDQGNALPYLDAVVLSFLPDRHQEFLQFTKGELEMLSGLDPAFQYELLTENGTLQADYDSLISFVKNPWLKTDYLGFLVDPDKEVNKNSPVLDSKVRLAINHAIDRQAMIRQLRQGVGRPATKGFVPEGMPGFDALQVEGYAYDVDKAKRLLVEAGYPEGSKIKVRLIASEQYRFIGEFIQNQLKKIGVELQLESMSSSAHKQEMASFQTNFFRKSWVADFPEASNFYQLFYSQNFAPDFGPNYTHFNSPDYDLLYEKSQQTESTEERYLIYNQMEEILKIEAPIVPLFYDQTARFYSKSVEGLTTNAMNMLDLRRVKIKRN